MHCQSKSFKALLLIHSNVGNKLFRRLLLTSPECSTLPDENAVKKKAYLKNIFSEENKVKVQDKLSSVAIPRTYKPKENARYAAVLMPLCTVNGEPSLLFMVRPMTMPQHRGEVCFPGGKADEGDRDLIHTALRESHEEIGLPEDNIDIWGKMVPVPSRDGMMQAVPVIGVCGEIDVNSFTLNKHEAESVFTRTLESLCVNVHSTQYRSHTGGYTLPVYTGGPHRIWGLTAIFVHQLLPLLMPELYNFKLKHVKS